MKSKEQCVIESTIQWNKPEDVVPPFNRKILVLVGGQEYSNGAWTKYLKPMEVIVSTEGPSDGEYAEFVSGESPFTDCQFYLSEMNSDDDDVSDWYSDSIVLWAESPLSGLMALVESN